MQIKLEYTARFPESLYEPLNGDSEEASVQIFSLDESHWDYPPCNLCSLKMHAALVQISNRFTSKQRFPATIICFKHILETITNNTDRRNQTGWEGLSGALTRDPSLHFWLQVFLSFEPWKSFCISIKSSLLHVFMYTGFFPMNWKYFIVYTNGLDTS